MTLFSVSETRKVEFSSGNLCYSHDRGYHFAEQVTGIEGDNIFFAVLPDAADHMGKRLLHSLHKVSPEHADMMRNAVDGNNLLDGWRLLTADEWQYVVNERPASTLAGMKNARYLKCSVEGCHGLLLFPDEYVHPEGVRMPHRININNVTTVFRRYDFSATEWTALKEAGCVFLPASGCAEYSYHEEKIEPLAPEEAGCYWTASADRSKKDKHLCFVFGERWKHFGRSKKCGIESDGMYKTFNLVRMVRDSKNNPLQN